MAITLPNTGRLSFGDLPTAAGSFIGITVAITFTPSSVVNDDVVAAQWKAGTPSDQAWLFQIQDTDELGWLVQGINGTTQYYGIKTTGLNMTAGTTYRIVGRYNNPGGGAVSSLWINGVSQSVTSFVAQSSILFGIQNSTEPAYVGWTSNVTNPGDYSEFAVWTGELSDDAIKAYGAGFSPRFLQRAQKSGGGTLTPLVYAPLYSTSDLTEVWGNTSITNTSGTTAAHPAVYTPKSAQAFRRDTVAAGATGSDWLRLALQGA